jgi:phosphate transport system substrate-binding protein
MNNTAPPQRRKQIIGAGEGNLSRLFLFFTLIFLALASSLSLTGCGSGEHALVIAGSTSVQPVMEKIIERYKKSHPGVRINVEGGGSSAGVMATLTKTAQIGMCSRELKKQDEKERQLTAHQIAWDAILIIVHPVNPVKALTIAQLRGIFSGTIRSWKEVGGPDRPIHLIVREEGSGTRSAFDELIMKEGKTEHEVDAYALVQDSMGGIREVVKGDPQAIGFISMGGKSSDVKPVAVDGVVPTFEAVRTKTYGVTRPFFLLTIGAPEGLAKEILAYVVSSATTEIMHEEGLVSVGP